MCNAADLVTAYKARGLTCATAESCTGGGVGSAITSVAGSSAVYLGGVVSYANSVKQQVLGVSASVLSEYGAVSAQCAEAMAVGVRQLVGSDWAVSITGIAGPDGGSAEKPVGLVWFGLAGGNNTLVVRSEHRIFAGDRAAVREQAVAFALQLLYSAVNYSAVNS